MYHGSIIQAGIRCKTKSCYMSDSVAGGLLLKILKYFQVMLNIFEFFYVKEIIEPWLVYVKKFHEWSNDVSWLRQ